MELSIIIYNREQLKSKNVASLKEICIERGIKLPETEKLKKEFIEKIMIYQQIKVPKFIDLPSFH